MPTAYTTTFPDGTIVTSFSAALRDYVEKSDLEKFSRFIPAQAVVYDFGAGIGSYSLYFSRYYQAKQVYSFENVQDYYDLLNTNLAQNNSLNIKTSKDSMPLSTAFNTMNQEHHSFVRIDEYRTESGILSAMTDILEIYKPVIMIKPRSFAETNTILLQYGYQLVDMASSGNTLNYLYMHSHKMAEDSVESVAIISLNADLMKYKDWYTKTNADYKSLTNVMNNINDSVSYIMSEQLPKKVLEISDAEDYLESRSPKIIISKHMKEYILKVSPSEPGESLYIQIFDQDFTKAASVYSGTASFGTSVAFSLEFSFQTICSKGLSLRTHAMQYDKNGNRISNIIKSFSAESGTFDSKHFQIRDAKAESFKFAICLRFDEPGEWDGILENVRVLLY